MNLGMTPEQILERALMAHEGHWAMLASLLRALDTDEQAGRSLHREARELMAKALRVGYEGREPTPKPPRADAYHKADVWVGMQLLRDIGPRGLSEVDWTALGGRLTQFAGTRICDRQDWPSVHACVEPEETPRLSRASQLSTEVGA